MDNRENILHCALNLFYQKGYDAVGIQEICQDAGITKPTMYHYFGSKAGLLEVLLEEMFSQLLTELSEVVEKNNGIEQALDDFASVIFEFASKNPKAYMLLMALSYSAKENELYRMVRPYITRLNGYAVQMFDNSAGQLGNMNNRQQQFAIGFLGVISHYLMLLAYREETDTIANVSEEVRRSLIHQFMHGIWT